MASFRRLPSGVWQATVKRNGRRVTRTDPLKKVLMNWAKNTELAIDRGVWRDPRAAKNATLAEWYAQWLPSRIVEPETARSGESVWRLHIEPRLGDRIVRDLTRLDVQAWVSALHVDGVGAGTVRKAYNYLRVFLAAAEDENLLDVSPCRRISLPAAPRKLPAWFTHEEVEAIVEALPEPHASMTLLMAWVGLRWGEAAGLRIGDVDWLRHRVSVVGTVTQMGKWKDYPKNSSSRREVPVPAWVLEQMAPEAGGRPREEQLFLTRRGSRPMSGANWRSSFWDPALERAGVAHRSPHALRHTAASWLVQDGVPLYDVQRQLGHADFQTTKRYAHLDLNNHGRVTGSWESQRAHEGRTDADVLDGPGLGSVRAQRE